MVATGTIPNQESTVNQHVYDAAGQRLKGVGSATGHTTVYVGRSYEKDTSSGQVNKCCVALRH